VSTPRFFALIIGTEILNRRRKDAHFEFLSQRLKQQGYTLSGCFVIEDNPSLIAQTIAFIAQQPQSVLFSFGGIGSTPDDHTRQAVATALSDAELSLHQEAKCIIEKALGKSAYPHPIEMAYLPKGATLLKNPINQMPAFALAHRFFFMPGFPQMSHPMVENILAQHFPQTVQTYRYTLIAQTKENLFIPLMKEAPQQIEVSSLPKQKEDGWEVTLSVSGREKEKTARYFQRYCKLLKEEHIRFKEIEES
jgi:molybdopterin-biosynthesis enzyme MoeA-like protein